MYFERCNNCKFMCGQRIVIDCEGIEVGVNLELNKDSCDSNGILCGKVIDKLGNPIQHALVKVVTETYDPVFQSKTDDEGNYFIFDIPAHNCYKLIAIAEQFRLSEEIKVCLTEQEVLSVNIMLSQSTSEVGVITGTILNRTTFLPVNKARILLFEDRNGEVCVKGITDTNEYGQFALTKLAPGKYNVKICMSGYISEQYSVNITNCAQILDHIVSLAPDNTKLKGVVSGVITDENKKPIPEADVILYKVEEDGGMMPIAYERANRDGVYMFINLETGSYKVIAK